MELITKNYSNEKTKENEKHLSSIMCYWNLDTNMWNILYSSRGATSRAFLGAVGKILSWNSHQSLQRIYLTGLCGHTCSSSLAADYFEITETNILSGVKCITKNWDCILAPGLIHCAMAIRIKQIQATLSREHWDALARASWLMTACCSMAPLLSQSCSPVFSISTALMLLENGTHDISKAFWISVWRSHTYFTSYKSVKYKCLFFWEITFGLTHSTSHVGDSP